MQASSGPQFPAIAEFTVCLNYSCYDTQHLLQRHCDARICQQPQRPGSEQRGGQVKAARFDLIEISLCCMHLLIHLRVILNLKVYVNITLLRLFMSCGNHSQASIHRISFLNTVGSCLHFLVPRQANPHHLPCSCSFTVAFTSAAAAVAFCMEVQYRLLDVPWPAECLKLGFKKRTNAQGDTAVMVSGNEWKTRIKSLYGRMPVSDSMGLEVPCFLFPPVFSS